MLPQNQCKKKYHFRKPWLSEALRTSIKHKNKLYHHYRKINSVKSEILYKSYKTKLAQILKTAEKEHYQDLFRKYKDNMKKSWGIIKRMVNRNQVQSYQTKFKLEDGRVINDKFNISKHFNDFFTYVGPNLAKHIPKVNINPLSFMKEALKETLFISPVTETEINKIVRALKDSATGHDDISSQFLKLALNSIVDPLTHICNMSLTEGVFPNTLKVANVIPLYKSDDPMCFNHYRPVSLLCILSKVFEKIMYDRLLNFVDKFDLLYAHQYGFRKNRSTYMALLSLVDNLTRALENGEHVVGVYLDFSKAFDTVDHMILLQKFYHYGVRGCAHDWFTSYLSNRSQFVTYNGVKSNLNNVKCGVPQGSILGPLLFLLYINDLSFACKRTFPVLFADDSNLFLSGKNTDQVQQMINDELKDIVIWLRANKLSLNISKTHYMLLSNKKVIQPNVTIEINGQPITCVTKTKFLGVIIDNKLTWKEHISYICGKVAKGIGIISKVRKYLNKNTLLDLYYSFIYPYLTYCNQVWGLSCQSYMNALVKLQKRAIRIISGVHPRTHTDPLFTELKLLKCDEINKYLVGRLMYRIYNEDITLFDSMFMKNEQVHNYDTRQRDHYHVPGFKSRLGKINLRYNGVIVWNSILSSGIPVDVSQAVFSKQLKCAIINGTLKNYMPGI